MSKTQFKKLFEPAHIGKMKLKNRIVLPPMATMLANEDGSVSQRTIDYYEARAKGGAGLIIVEITAPSLQCTELHQLSLGDDSYLPGWKELVKAVHQHGAKIAVQLQHSTMEKRDGRIVQVGPSAVIVPARIMGMPGNPSHELTVTEIDQIVGWFAAAAGRAKKAGFDGVEIHGAHQYLVAAFLSSATNQRQDKYGGSVENKARILIEILQACRKEVGSGFPLWIRLNGREWGVDNGVTIEETKQVVQLAVQAGAQAVHVSGYGAGSFSTTAPLADTPGILVPLAAEVKKITSVPIITVGRMDPELGEQVLEEGKADLIAMGRRMLADPDLPDKVDEGQLDDINACIGCMECIERRAPGAPLGEQSTTCTINPVAGNEREYQIKPAEKKKKVIVIGGGPGGMVAARVAALRGHNVILFEKSSKLGGQLNVAALPPHKEDIIPWINYLAGQMTKTGVEVRLNTEATAANIVEIKPDAVVIATGSIASMPDVRGIDRPFVVTAGDVLHGKKEAGQRVVVIGGGMVGCETGLYLAAKGKQVAIVEMLKRAAHDMYPMVRRRLMDGLRANKVILFTSACCEEISAGGVTVTTGEGKRETIPADTVVIAVGYQSDNSLFKQLQGKAPLIYCIGDAFSPRRILEAVHEGYRTGLQI
ncbi:MAG: FAD-dependent oxidoreductase [Chloroflexi bacterium]|nr:FAD-dependent oxidoreductase [Chloroflexota bacterium]